MLIHRRIDRVDIADQVKEILAGVEAKSMSLYAQSLQAAVSRAPPTLSC